MFVVLNESVVKYHHLDAVHSSIGQVLNVLVGVTCAK